MRCHCTPLTGDLGQPAAVYQVCHHSPDRCIRMRQLTALNWWQAARQLRPITTDPHH